MNSCKFLRFATACVNHLTLPCVVLILKSAVMKVYGRRATSPPRWREQCSRIRQQALRSGSLGTEKDPRPDAFGRPKRWCRARLGIRSSGDAKWGPASCLSRSSSGPQEIETVAKGYKAIFELSVAARRLEPDYAYGFFAPCSFSLFNFWQQRILALIDPGGVFSWSDQA